MTLIEAALSVASSSGVGALAAWFTARRRAQVAEARVEASKSNAETRLAGEQLKHDAVIAPQLLARLEAVENGRARDREECAEEIEQARAEAGESVKILAEEIKAMLRAQAEIARKVEGVPPPPVRRRLTELDEPTGVHRMEELVTRARSISSQSIPAVPGVPTEDP